MNKSLRKQMGFSVLELIIVVVIVAVVCAVGFVVYNHNKKTATPSATKSSTTSSTNQSSSTNTASSIPANWSWYENKDAGFKFAYPKDWTVGEPTHPTTTQNEVGWNITVKPPSPKDGDPTLNLDSYPSTAHIYDVDKYDPNVKVPDTKISSITIGDAKSFTLAGSISESSDAKNATTMYLTSCWDRYCAPHLSNGRFFEATLGSTTSSCEPHIACNSVEINTSSPFYADILNVLKTVASL